MKIATPDILIFLAERAVEEGTFGNGITAAWAHSTYAAYSHYGEDDPDFTEADIATVRTMADDIQGIKLPADETTTEAVRKIRAWRSESACVEAADLVIIKLTAETEAIRKIRAWRRKYGLGAPGSNEPVTLGDLSEDTVFRAVDDVLRFSVSEDDEDSFPTPFTGDDHLFVQELVYQRLNDEQGAAPSAERTRRSDETE